MEQPLTPETPVSRLRSRIGESAVHLVPGGALIIICTFFLFLYGIDQPPSAFPVNIEITIEEGASVTQAANYLQSKGVIRSSTYLKLVLHRRFDNAYIRAGSYSFPHPLTTTAIVRSITTGAYSSPTFRATFPEGFRVKNMAKYLPDRFSEAELDEYRTREGYLFPDTYFFENDATLDEIVVTMQNTFDEKTALFDADIASSSLTKAETVILASILEREASGSDSMRMVAGILLERLRIGMPLQVDAAFEYILGKGSHELTEDDLELDSPFNTYNHKGLPPAPISNPGLMAIESVLNPTLSQYLYYLTDTDGTFHYAETFEEHKMTKERYLR